METLRAINLTDIDYRQIPGVEVLDREGLSITFCSSVEGARPSDFPTQKEIEKLYRLTHPLMPDELLEKSAARFFKEPPSDLGLMDLIYLRDGEKLVAAGAFSRTLLKDDEEKDGKIVSYCCYRLVHPKLQGKGIGKLISRLVLDVVNPDILLSFTTQTSSYHSWRSVVNELGNRYIMYPRLKEGLSYRTSSGMEQAASLDDVIVLEGSKIDTIERALKKSLETSGIGIAQNFNLGTKIDFSRMVFPNYRKKNFFSHQPWTEDDVLTQALTLKDTDAVVLAIIKKSESNP